MTTRKPSGDEGRLIAYEKRMWAIISVVHAKRSVDSTWVPPEHIQRDIDDFWRYKRAETEGDAYDDRDG